MLTLYFLWMPGCPACDAAEPAFLAYKAAHSARVLCLSLNCEAPNPFRPGGYDPAKTPGYRLMRLGKELITESGAKTLEELTAWVTKHAEAAA